MCVFDDEVHKGNEHEVLHLLHLHDPTLTSQPSTWRAISKIRDSRESYLILFIILPSTIFPSKFSKDLIIYSNERGWLDASKYAWLRKLSLKGVDRPPAAILILSAHRLHSFLPTEKSTVVDRSSNIQCRDECNRALATRQ